MQSNLAFDRMAVATAIEHLLEAREEGWIEAAQLVVDYSRAVKQDKHKFSVAVGHYVLTNLDFGKAPIALFSHFQEPSSSTCALFYDWQTQEAHTLARTDIVESTSKLKYFVVDVVNMLYYPLLFVQGVAHNPEGYFQVRPDIEWTVIYSTRENLKPGMTTTRPWQWY